MQPLPGFRDFLPDDCAFRNAVFARWREVCRGYGFVEWDGPILEPTELYKKKSGPEIVAQLFNFTDKGDREVAMRPELTPSLARVVATHERGFRKPLKWFSIPQCFRYEKQQRGRLREHFQLNCDLIGDASPAADVEVIALAIDLLRGFGFSENDFVVRVNDRERWTVFLDSWRIPRDDQFKLLDIIDKMDRVGEEETKRRIDAASDIPWQEIQNLMSNPLEGPSAVSHRLLALFDTFRSRGLDQYLRLDCSLVRGLAYYTGVVFEVFDRSGKFRAIAGGGRYDKLIHQLSDGAVSLPAVGFAMGDVVLGELISNVPAARDRIADVVRQENNLDLYLIIAKEERRANALLQLQQLRDAGWRVDYSLSPAKVGKQFQTAEALGTKATLLYGDEWPAVKMKNLATREEVLVLHEELLGHLRQTLSSQ
jgi:histidyl-tRNA synthetase